jgi:hypothetical protein
MFRHYCVILSAFVVSTLPIYTNMSNAWQGTNYELPEDDTVVSKRVKRGVIIYQLIVHWLVTIQNNKRYTVQRIKIKKNTQREHLIFSISNYIFHRRPYRGSVLVHYIQFLRCTGNYHCDEYSCCVNSPA